MPGFVLEYHRPTGELRVHQFLLESGHRDALRCRLELEARRDSDDWEIVSINSASLSDLKRTHARYFREIVPLAG